MVVWCWCWFLSSSRRDNFCRSVAPSDPSKRRALRGPPSLFLGDSRLLLAGTPHHACMPACPDRLSQVSKTLVLLDADSCQSACSTLPYNPIVASGIFEFLFSYVVASCLASHVCSIDFCSSGPRVIASRFISSSYPQLLETFCAGVSTGEGSEEAAARAEGAEPPHDTAIYWISCTHKRQVTRR